MGFYAKIKLFIIRSPYIILDFEDNSSSSRTNPLSPGLKLLSESCWL